MRDNVSSFIHSCWDCRGCEVQIPIERGNTVSKLVTPIKFPTPQKRLLKDPLKQDACYHWSCRSRVCFLHRTQHEQASARRALYSERQGLRCSMQPLLLCLKQVPARRSYGQHHERAKWMQLPQLCEGCRGRPRRSQHQTTAGALQASSAPSDHSLSAATENNPLSLCQDFPRRIGPLRG